MLIRWAILLIIAQCSIAVFAQSDSLATKENADSLRTAFLEISPKQKLDSANIQLTQSLKHYKDSLRHFKTILSRDSLKSDSLTRWYRKQQASISGLAVSQKDKKQRLDSLKDLYTTKNKDLLTEQKKHVDQLQVKQQKVQKEIQTWKEKCKALLKPLDSLGLSSNQHSMSDKNMPNGLPNVSDDQGELPQYKLPDASVNMPDVQLPTADLGVDVPSLSGEIPSVSIPKSPELNDLKIAQSLPEVAEIQQRLSEIEQMESDFTKYKEELDSIDREKIEGELENRITDEVSKLEEVQAIQKGKGMTDAEMQKILQYQALMRQYQDKQFIQAQMEQKSKTIATDILAKQAPRVDAAQQKLSKSQRKYRQFSSLKDAKLNRFNSLKGRPFSERFFYGFSAQFQREDQQDIFITPQVYYRVTGRFASGLGFTYRTQFETKPEFSWGTTKVWGPRGFVKIGFRKSLFIQGEYEYLIESQAEKNVSSGRWMGGLGKSFRLRKRIKGETILLNNFSYKKDDIYNSRLNLRIAFIMGKSLR